MTPGDAPMMSTGLVLTPGMKALDIRAAVTKRVNELVASEAHVAVIAVATPGGLRFASAQRIGGHLQFFQDVTFAGKSSGKQWTGEVGLVAEW